MVSNIKRFFSLFLITLMMGVCTSIEAQKTENTQEIEKRGAPKSQNRFEEFKARKTAFLIKEVGITKEEGDQFFPLYNELQEKKFHIQRDVRNKKRAIDQATESVASAIYLETATAMNNAKLKEAQLDNEYFGKFKKIFSADKLYRLQVAELKFNAEALRDMHRKH